MMTWVDSFIYITVFLYSDVVSSFILQRSTLPLNYFIAATFDAMVAVSLNSFGKILSSMDLSKVGYFKYLSPGYLLFLADTEFDYNVDYESYSQIQIILIAGQCLDYFGKANQMKILQMISGLIGFDHTGFGLR